MVVVMCMSVSISSCCISSKQGAVRDFIIIHLIL